MTAHAEAMTNAAECVQDVLAQMPGVEEVKWVVSPPDNPSVLSFDLTVKQSDHGWQTISALKPLDTGTNFEVSVIGCDALWETMSFYLEVPAEAVGSFVAQVFESFGHQLPETVLSLLHSMSVTL
jgi:hypothetical protein